MADHASLTTASPATSVLSSRPSVSPLSKPLLHLVRQVIAAGAGLPVERAAGGQLRLGRTLHPPEFLQQAVSLGLVRHEGNLVSPTAEARGFVKRMMLEDAARKAKGEGHGEGHGNGSDPAATAFAGQHRDLVATTVDIDGRRQNATRNLDESPLSGLSRLKDKAGTAFFPAEALDAGERLLADFTRGQLQPRMTSSWEPRLSARSKGEAGGMADLAASAIEARRRVGRAMEAMGPELCGVAADICCFGKGLELVERERQWPARSAKLMLRTALLALARHYAPPPAKEPARRSHHWGADGFRPSGGAYGSSAR